MSVPERRKHLYVNFEPLDRLTGLAGLTDREFAEDYCDLTAVTYSKARSGRPVRPSTLRKIAVGATRLRTLRGFDGIEEIVKSEKTPREVALAGVREDGNGQPASEP